MRIDIYSGPSQVPESDRTNPQNNSGAAGSANLSQPGEDQAQLSGAHVRVAALAAQAAQLPEAREERVHALRDAVQSGDYHPDAYKLAGALLEHITFGPAT